MTETIKRKNPKYVDEFTDRHDHARYYFRRKGLRRVALPGLPWSPEFMAAYAEALNDQPVARPKGLRRIAPGSVDAAIVAYLASPDYLDELKSPKSRKFRKSILEAFSKTAGPGPLKLLKREHVQAIVAKLSPAAQGNWVKALRHWIKFCLKANLIDASPLNDIIMSKVDDTGGFRPWTEDDVTKYRAFYPLGSTERLAMELMLNLGIRVSDAAEVGPANFKGGCLVDYQPVKGRRTGGLLINVRVHPDLVDALSAMKVVGSATYLVTPRGGAFTADYLSERMRTWCAAAGLPDETASHGLRKLCLMRLAEAGCTAFEIMSISGHKNLKEVQRYVEAASRKKMGEAAHAKLLAVQNTNKSVPTPAPRVGHSPK